MRKQLIIPGIDSGFLSEINGGKSVAMLWENDKDVLGSKEIKILLSLALFVFMVHIWYDAPIG